MSVMKGRKFFHKLSYIFLLPHFSFVIPFYYKNNISCEFSFSILTHIICLNGSVSWIGQKTISVFGKTIPQHNDFIIWFKNNPFLPLFTTFMKCVWWYNQYDCSDKVLANLKTFVWESIFTFSTIIMLLNWIKMLYTSTI